MNSGFVSIVGAGPGAPDLLTLRAARRLRHADLVLYDGLVPLPIVRLASKAGRLRVSRRLGEARLTPADAVSVMTDAATRGQLVVRLRAGDPLVLARGAEEALGLVAAGVPFEIVPGLSSALAAPTLASIPVTHRGVASGFAVVSGHSIEIADRVLASLTPHSATIVVLMGVGHRAEIATRLIGRAWRPDTPAAVITNASRRHQRVWFGSLRELAQEHAAPTRPEPGVIVIGDAVGVGATLAAALSDRKRGWLQKKQDISIREDRETSWPL